MKKNNFIFYFALLTFLFSKSVSTTLENYAYDFSIIGYDIKFPATSEYYEPMNAGDYFRAKDKGYTIKVRIETLSRNSRKEFVSYYNQNCKYDMDETCRMIIAGEVELNESMEMMLSAKRIYFQNKDRTRFIKSFE